MKERVLLIIPAFNEALSLGNLLQAVSQTHPAVDILVVNDGSLDATARIAQAAGCRVVSHPFNLGYAAALETGYSYALREGFPFVIQMDADGQHLPNEIETLLEPLRRNEADIVLGSRFLKPGAGYAPPFLRRMGHRFFSWLFRFLTGISLTDPTSGFQGLNRAALELFVGRFPEDFPDTDVLLMAHYSGLRLKEVGTGMVERCAGTSMHDGFRPLYYVLKMFISIAVVILNFKRRPA